MIPLHVSCGNGTFTVFLTGSDEDEFYDRTQKSSKHKNGDNQSVETADSLLDKKDALVKQIEDKEKLLVEEEKSAEVNETAEAGDALDAYMSAVSSQLGMLVLFLCSLVMLTFQIFFLFIVLMLDVVHSNVLQHSNFPVIA